MELMDSIIGELERAVEAERRSFDPDDWVYKQADILVMGQFALMLDKNAAANLELVATMDFDAVIKADWFVTQALRRSLESRGLVYDELSGEIWIPDDARYLGYYESEILKVSYLDPLSTLTSKAIKAKEKNRALVRRALAYYGNALRDRIIKYGADLSFFSDEPQPS